jgi:hypothetical protein
LPVGQPYAADETEGKVQLSHPSRTRGTLSIFRTAYDRPLDRAVRRFPRSGPVEVLRIGQSGHAGQMQITKTPTPRVERLWAKAEQEAERRGHDHVGTEHLLLALASDPEGAAGWLLLAHGLRDELSSDLEELLDSIPPAYATAA